MKYYLLLFISSLLLANAAISNYAGVISTWQKKYSAEYGEDIITAVLETNTAQKLYQQRKDEERKGFLVKDRKRLLIAMDSLKILKEEENLSELQLKERAKVLLGVEIDIGDPEILLAILEAILTKVEGYLKDDINNDISTAIAALKTELKKHGSKSIANYDSLLSIINKFIFDDDKIPQDKLALLNDISDGIMMLKTAILYEELTLVQKDILAKLKHEFLDMAKSGSAKNVELNFQIGSGLGSLASIKLTISPSCYISTGDDLSISQGCRLGFNVSGNFTASILAKLSAYMDVAGSKEKMFLGIEQWLEHNIDKHSSAILGSILGPINTFGPKSLIKAYKKNANFKKVASASMMNQGLLLNFLIRHGLINEGDSLAIRIKDKEVPINVNKQTFKLGFSSSFFDNAPSGSTVVGSLLSLGGEGEIKLSSFSRSMPLLPYLLSDGYTREKLLNKHENLIIIKHHDRCKLRKIKDDSQDPLKKDQAQKDLSYCFDVLHKEIIIYTDIVNLVDKKTVSSSSSVKESFEKDRLSAYNKGKITPKRGRALMLKSFIYTYVFMRDIYDNMALELNPHLAKILLAIEKDLQNPRFYLDSADIKKLSKIKVAKSISKTMALTTSIAGRRIEFTLNVVDGHPYPDNNGTSIGIKLPAELVMSKDLLAKVWPKINEKLLASANVEFAEDERDNIIKVLDGLGSIDINVALGPITFGQNTSLNLNFVLIKDKFKLQYLREIKNISIDGRVEDVPLSLGVQIGGGAKLFSAENIYERIGLHTLSYVATVYNGSRLGMKNNDGPNIVWSNFASHHQDELIKIAQNINNNNNNNPLKEELMAMEAEIDDLNDNDVSSSFANAISDINNDPSIVNLVQLLEIYHDHIYVNKIDKAYKKK